MASSVVSSASMMSIASPSSNDRLTAMVNQVTPSLSVIRAIGDLFESRYQQDLINKEDGEIRFYQSHVNPIGRHRNIDGTFTILAIRHDCVVVKEMRTSNNEKSWEVLHECSADYMLNLSEIDLSHPKATASILLDAIEKAMLEFIKVSNKGLPIEIDCLVSAFPLEVMTLQSAFIRDLYTRAEVTEEPVTDPLCGIDVARLVVIGLERRNIAVSLHSVLTDSVATILAGAYEKRVHAPRCLVSACVDKTLNFAFHLPNADEASISGSLVDFDVALFRGWVDSESLSLFKSVTVHSGSTIFPISLADIQVDYAEAGPQTGRRLLQRLIVGSSFGEIVRLSALEILQHRAPKGIWKAHSLSFEAVMTILDDEVAPHTATQEILKAAWGGNEEKLEKNAVMLRAVANAVVTRSAALLSVILAGICKHTGRLQPALGGVSIATCGQLLKNSTYLNLLRMHLDDIFAKDTAELIRFVNVDNAPDKGAALMGYKIRNKC